MMTTDKKLVKKYFDGEYEIVDDPYLSYRIHIGKRAAGWKPIFEAHNNAYDSVSGLLDFLQIHRDKIEIYDEYNKLLSIVQLKEELIDWAKNQEKKMVHYDDYIGEIQSPIDHVEMDQRDNRNLWLKIKYWHDKDGYDFTDRTFS